MTRQAFLNLLCFGSGFAGVCIVGFMPTSGPPSGARQGSRAEGSAEAMLRAGRQTFRYDTFGSEDFFGGQLGLNNAIAGSKNGGVGDGVSPKVALSLGLKVDASALPDSVVDGIKNGKVNLDDPATTLALLKLNAVVGVQGFFDGPRLKSVGITCALCHSTVDDSFAHGIGRRLDGWPNKDLNVGAIVAASPSVAPFQQLLGVNAATVRAVLNSWGPGRYDAELNLDGKAFRPDGKPGATLIPPAFGLAGVNNHTWTGSWGTVTYWNAYVAVLEMHGKGNFYDPRFDDPVKYPVAARTGQGHTHSADDRVTAKLGDLQFYQLSLQTPRAPAGSFNEEMAKRGGELFNGPAKCASCHVPPLYTEPGWNLHTPAEIGIDDFQAMRSPNGLYRTEPLRALWNTDKIHKNGFYHDGRYATLMDVVNHYDQFFSLNLTMAQKLDLIEFLKSL